MAKTVVESLRRNLVFGSFGKDIVREGPPAKAKEANKRCVASFIQLEFLGEARTDALIMLSTNWNF